MRPPGVNTSGERTEPSAAGSSGELYFTSFSLSAALMVCSTVSPARTRAAAVLGSTMRTSVDSALDAL
jgi:hypothetical protein